MATGGASMDGVTSKMESMTMDDLRGMTARELGQLLKERGLPSGARNHRLSRLALELGFTEMNEAAECVTLFRTMKGWTKDIRNCPPISMANLTEYLVDRHGTDVSGSGMDMEFFSRDCMKRYKTLRSFNLYESGHVHSVKFVQPPDSEYCAVQSLCNPSWDTSGKMYEPLIILDRYSGTPHMSSCTCVAGLGQACTHVAATLFAMEDFTSRGLHDLPDDVSSTDLLCKWTEPRGPKVQPVPLSQVNLQSDPGKRPFRNVQEHNPVRPNKRGVDPVAYGQLVTDLQGLGLDCPFLTIVDPEIMYEGSDYHGGSQTFLELPDRLEEYDCRLVPAKVIDVSTSPSPPKTMLEKAGLFMANVDAVTDDSVNEFMDSLAMTKDDQDHINSLTLGQSKNKQWKEFKKGVISSTRTHSVLTRMRKFNKKPGTAVSTLIDTCMGEREFVGNASTRYGLRYEEVAANCYLQMMTGSHRNARLVETGLLLKIDAPYIATSVDRIMICDCHPRRPVEIKCPSTMANLGPSSFGQLRFLDETKGKFVLRKGPYFTQVQTHMAVLCALNCDFVVWSPEGFVVIDVPFDNDFWKEVSELCTQFFKQHLAPAMLARFSK